MIGIALALAVASAEPMIPAFFTGERLLDICTKNRSGQCWMYVAGVLDGIFLADPASAELSVCGDSLTNRAAARRVTAYLKENPAVREKAAAVAVKAAMTSEASCED